MKEKLLPVIFWVAIYSVAMAFLESAVVVYIRELYYPDGFLFPLKLIDKHIAVTELIREIATVIMLLAIAFLSGKSAAQRFAYFILSFAIWDIFYYVFLYFILAWPASIMDWDVLFLLPVTWVGPVIAPVINSLMMIVLAIVILRIDIIRKINIPKWTWALLIIGSFVVIIAYTEDYISYMINYLSFSEMINPSNTELIFKYALNYIPDSFNWYIYLAGIGMHLAGILYLISKNKING